MSLLWSDTLYVGLFPGYCWLESRRIKIEHTFAFDHGNIEQDIIHVLDELLIQQRVQIGLINRVVLTVSDSFGAIVDLPWRDELDAENEIHNYARICLERRFLSIDNTWAMHTEFLSFRQNGLAYAFPNVWLDQLKSIFARHKLKIAQLLPVSAAFYCKQKQFVKKGAYLLMLTETKQTTGLLFARNGLLAMDVEPVLQSMTDSCNRLFRRIVLNNQTSEEMTRVGFWSPTTEESNRDFELVSNFLDGAKIEHIPRNGYKS